MWTLDTALFLLINGGLRAGWLDALLAVVSAAGTGGLIFWLGLVAGFLAARGQARFTATLGMGTMLLVVALGEGLLKHLVERPRPWFELPLNAIHHLGPYPHTSSFPSMHTAAAFALAVVVGARHRRWRWPLLGFALLMGYSRIYVGDHYPLDVLAGAGLGTLCGVAMLLLGGRTVVRLRARRPAPATRPGAPAPPSPDLRIVTVGAPVSRPGERLLDRPVPIYTMKRNGAAPTRSGAPEDYEPVDVFLPRAERGQGTDEPRPSLDMLPFLQAPEPSEGTPN